MEQEVQAQTEVHNEQVAQESNSNDVLANLQLSENAKKELEANKELLGIISHNVEAKREANKEAKTYREEYEALKKAKDEAEKEKLKEQGEFKKLYEKALADNADKEAKIKQVTINSKLSALATQKGIKKVDYLKMFDTSSFDVDENLNIPGLEEKFNTFYLENQDLFNVTNNPLTTQSLDTGKPQVSVNSSVNAELKTLEDRAKKGTVRDMAILREFKKAHGLLKK